MKFDARYSPTIMDGAVVRWGTGYNRGTLTDMFSGEPRISWSAEISASRNGVLIHGIWRPITSAEDIVALCAKLREAFEVHRSLNVHDNDKAHEFAKAMVAKEKA